MKKNKDDYIVYDYISRSDVISDQMAKSLNKVYAISYPKPEKSFIEMCKDIEKEAEKQGKSHDRNFRLEYKNKETGKTYMWPLDFFYIPHDVLKTIWDNHRESYGIEEHWRDNVESLIKFLFEKPGFKEVYKKTEYSQGEKVRTSEDQPLLKDVIGEENANKVKSILEDYAHTYRWGLSDVNHFCSGFLSTPTCNRETVVEAWKTAFNKDIVIPDDDKWIDNYEFGDMEYEGEFEEEEDVKEERI